ncbi:MAG: hypothetical protein IR153_10605 [Flavobacterium sp.]|nr:hypothetical protein [Flavobacterium sp.]
MAETGMRVGKILIIAYFVIAVVEIFAELLNVISVIMIAKPLMPLTLMAVYMLTSERRHLLYFFAMFFSFVTNILFIPDNDQMLLYGLVAFLIHRVLLLTLVFKIIKLTDYIPLAIAMLPFLLIFTYLLFSSDVPQESFYILNVQNLLIAVLGGLALSNYIMHDDRKNTWLLISGLLFVALQFIVFIEKYFLSDLSPAIFRPIAMALNAFAFYTFYEFVLASEKSDDNSVSA